MAYIKILRCPRLKVRKVTITAAIKGRGWAVSSCAATITIPHPYRSLSPGQITSYKLIFTGYVNSRETGPLINSAISIFRRVASSRALSVYNEILEHLLRKFCSLFFLPIYRAWTCLDANYSSIYSTIAGSLANEISEREGVVEPIFCQNT